MMRRIFASAVLAAALITTGCADSPADPVTAPTASSTSTAATPAAAEGDKAACVTFTTAAAKLGSEVSALSTDVATVMGSDQAKAKEALDKVAKAYTEFATQVRTSAGQASSADLKDALGKLADLAEAASTALNDPASLKEPQKLIATLTNPEIKKLQETVQSSCA